jgi:predicted benzoate:H+ symporter BenE
VVNGSEGVDEVRGTGVVVETLTVDVVGVVEVDEEVAVVVVLVVLGTEVVVVTGGVTTGCVTFSNSVTLLITPSYSATNVTLYTPIEVYTLDNS